MRLSPKKTTTGIFFPVQKNWWGWGGASSCPPPPTSLNTVFLLILDGGIRAKKMMFSTIQRGTAHGKSRLTSFLGWVTVFVVCSSYSSPCYIIGNWLDHMLWSNTCRPIRQQHSQAYILNPLRRASHIDALLNSWENLSVRRIHQKKRHDPLNRSEKTNIVPSSVYIGCNCVLLYAFFLL